MLVLATVRIGLKTSSTKLKQVNFCKYQALELGILTFQPMKIKILAQNNVCRLGSLRALHVPEALKNVSKNSGLILGGQVVTRHRMT